MSQAGQFSHAPLEEVAFEISFFPKLKIVEKLADFQDRLATTYPQLGEEYAFRSPDAGRDSGIIDTMKKRFSLTNPEGTRAVRLSIISLNVVERKYESFNRLKDEIIQIWNWFCDTVKDIKAQRIGLRYINRLRIPLPCDLTKLQDITRLYFAPSRFENEEEIHVINQEATVKRKDTLLTIRSGILGVETDLQANNKQQLIYLLDYDSSFQLKGETVTSLDQKLDLLHDTVESQFLNDVLPSYKEYMETGQWK
ncbi:MAG TPA: TIGR04255 family protein [Candidatus Deferrimicrobium sp.]|nr:TIGR04255 family protein [Candidatus Deferrimicrobium sp.]